MALYNHQFSLAFAVCDSEHADPEACLAHEAEKAWERIQRRVNSLFYRDADGRIHLSHEGREAFAHEDTAEGHPYKGE